MPDQRGAEGNAMVGGPAKMRDAQNRSGPRQLNDRVVQRDGAIERGRRPENAVAADHRGLDRVSIRKSHDQ
jgi:hypothetical protein